MALTPSPGAHHPPPPRPRQRDPGPHGLRDPLRPAVQHRPEHACGAQPLPEVWLKGRASIPCRGSAERIRLTQPGPEPPGQPNPLERANHGGGTGTSVRPQSDLTLVPQWPESHLPRSLSRHPGVHVIVTPMATLPPDLHRNHPAPCMIDGRPEGLWSARKIQVPLHVTAS